MPEFVVAMFVLVGSYVGLMIVTCVIISIVANTFSIPFTRVTGFLNYVPFANLLVSLYIVYKYLVG